MTNAIYSPHEFPWATLYFAQKPVEPGGVGLADIPVNPTDSWSQKITLNDFYMLTRNLQPGSDVVLYTHGDASKDVGVSMWLDKAYKTLLTLDVVQALGEMTSQQFERRYKLPAQLVDIYRKQISEIQACQLNHVAFRSCNIGKRPDYLRAFAKLFNVRVVSAPKMRDFFARDPVRRLTTDEIAGMDSIATPQNLGKYTKTSKDKSRKSDAKYWSIKVGNDEIRISIIPISYGRFYSEIMASTARSIEQFYRQFYHFRIPVQFGEFDFYQDGFAKEERIVNPFCKVVPLFGLSEFGSADRFFLPKEPAYVQQIQVVQNEHFVGGVPMYNAPPPDPNEPIGTLRDRMKRRVLGMLNRR